jgi:hypothetical protein
MINKIRISSFVIAALLPVASLAQPASGSLSSGADQTLLPDNYTVFTNGSVVINHPMPGFVQKTLPTNNDYKKNPGCYIACYSRNKENGIYSVGSNIFVNGQVRVAGSYKNRICVPTGYENKDISKEDAFNVQCAKISTCTNNQCWAGGDTGGWFGIQQ